MSSGATPRIDCHNGSSRNINWTVATHGRLLVAMKTHRIGLVPNPATLARHATHLGLLVAVGLCWSACQPQVEVSEGTDVSGTYTLVTVNGSKTPAVVSHEGAKLEVRSGTFTIKADGTCSSRMIFVPPSGTESTREVTATYTREGSTLHMKWKGAGKTQGTVEGNTFTMNNEGMIFVYEK
jgi:hypothetical protein